MENPVFTELFSLVDQIRETDDLIKMVEKPDSKVVVALPNSMITLGDETDQYLKAKLVDQLKKDQLEGWNKVLEIMNANSPFQ